MTSHAIRYEWSRQESAGIVQGGRTLCGRKWDHYLWRPRVAKRPSCATCRKVIAFNKRPDAPMKNAASAKRADAAYLKKIGGAS